MISAENSPLIGIPDGHPNGKASNGTQERNPDGDPLKKPSFTGILKNPGESMLGDCGDSGRWTAGRPVTVFSK